MLADKGSRRDATAQSQHFAARVGQAFPSLSMNDCRLEQSGGDHVLLIIDDRLVFRFPRSGMHGLDLEIAVLRHLQPHSRIVTPMYRYVDPAGRFAGYPMIAGAELTAARFTALSQARRHDLLRTAARFLATLHGLAADTIAPLAQWPLSETPAECAHRGLTRHLPAAIRHFPKQAGPIESFYDRYQRMTSPPLVVVHGDLVSEHLLLDEHSGQLAGIIDFSDVALGDPAQDFLGFWAYGADAMSLLVEHYPPSRDDPGISARSRGHFIRYRLDRIFESMTSDEADHAPLIAEINALFSAG